MSSIPTHPKSATTPQLPQSPSHPLRSLKKLYLTLLLLQLERLNWHWKFPPQLYHRLWSWLSLPTWHPFAYSCGASRGSISAGWRGAVRGHQPHVPLFVHICAGIIYGQGWGVPPVPELFSIWMPSGVIEKFIMISNFNRVYISCQTAAAFVIFFLNQC